MILIPFYLDFYRGIVKPYKNSNLYLNKFTLKILQGNKIVYNDIIDIIFVCSKGGGKWRLHGKLYYGYP